MKKASAVWMEDDWETKRKIEAEGKSGEADGFIRMRPA